MAKSRWITLPSALIKKKGLSLDPKIVDDGGFLDAAAALATPNARSASGTARADRLIGTSSNDSLSGLGGNDLLDGRKGRDRMIGGTGNDTYIVDNTGDRVTEKAKGGTDLVKASVNWTLGSQVENLTLTGSKALKGTGNSLANTITGNSGHNVLDGKAGADKLAGGKGNDIYIVDNTQDRITEKANEGIDTVQASVSYSLSAHVENLVLFGSALFGTGNDLANRIIGTGLANQLDGAAGNDTLLGGAGDDTLDGGSGADSLQGSTGNDRLDGGAGADTLDGGSGDDLYEVDDAGDTVIERPDSGIDTVRASADYTLSDNVERLMLTGGALRGTGNDLNNTITGNGLANSLSGGAGNDTLDGGAGADRLDGGDGADVLQGGAGNDLYIVDNANDEILETFNGGIDSVLASVDYVLGDNAERLTLIGAALTGTGNARDNTIIGNALGNSLSGGEGNDTLDGGAGADTLIGGLGNDVYEIDDAGDVTDEQGGGTDVDTVRTTLHTYSLAAGIEVLVMLDASAGNTATGNTLNNDITTGSNDDTLNGGGGADTLHGGAGNDTYMIDSMTDVIVEMEGGGIDTVFAYFNGYTLGAHVENLTLMGITATRGYGNGLDNRLTGTATGNLLEGREGNDTLDGGGGLDELWGGLGNDVYIVDGNDAVAEAAGEGTDTVETSVSLTLPQNVEILVLTGAGNINGTGNGADNRIVGNGGHNILDGGGGTDTLEGGAGNDIYVLDRAGETIIDTSGTDTVRASYEFGTFDWRGDGLGPILSNLTVTHQLDTAAERLELTGNASVGVGNAGNNYIVGNSQRNVLFGNGGNDTLNGGEGNDVLFAGRGPDRKPTHFEFSGKLGHDTLRDFNPFGGDIIDLRPFNRVVGGHGNFNITEVVLNPNSPTIKSYRITVSASAPGEAWVGYIDLPGFPVLQMAEEKLRQNILLWDNPPLL